MTASNHLSVSASCKKGHHLTLSAPPSTCQKDIFQTWPTDTRISPHLDAILGADQLRLPDAWLSGAAADTAVAEVRRRSSTGTPACISLQRASCENSRHFTARKQSSRRGIPQLTSLGTNRIRAPRDDITPSLTARGGARGSGGGSDLWRVTAGRTDPGVTGQLFSVRRRGRTVGDFTGRHILHATVQSLPIPSCRVDDVGKPTQWSRHAVVNSAPGQGIRGLKWRPAVVVVSKYSHVFGFNWHFWSVIYTDLVKEQQGSIEEIIDKVDIFNLMYKKVFLHFLMPRNEKIYHILCLGAITKNTDSTS